MMYSVWHRCERNLWRIVHEMVLVIKQMIKTNYLLLQLQPYVISLKKSVFPSSSFLPQMDFSFDVSPFASAITNSYRAMCVTLQHP